MNTIIITGTPGTGKTVFAKKLAKELGFRYLSINNLDKSIFTGYDKLRKTKIVDTDRMIIAFKNLLRNSKDKGIIFESHLAHYLPKRFVNLCIVLTTDIKVLKNRLAKRKYPKSKIQENLQAEIFESIYNEALEQEHNVLTIDTSKQITANKWKGIMRNVKRFL